MDASEPLSVFSPAPHQWTVHERLQRYSVLVCHRGFGKTVLAVNELLKSGAEEAGTEYAYIAPFRKQAKDVAWGKVLKPYAGAIPGVSFNESDLRCELPNGSGVQLFGGENAHSLRGMHLSGAVFDEFAQMRTGVWKEVVYPALQRKQGTAIFIGTPKGRNHFYELYEYARRQPDWYAEMWPASTSGVYQPEELEEFRRTIGPDLFAQEYECSWEAAIEGAFYARQLEAARIQGRIKTLTWEPAIPVDTWWDLGFTDSTAIIFGQKVGRELHLIDYVESHGEDLAWYANAVRSRPYLYGTHYLPHDASHPEQGSGKTLEEQLRLLGIKPSIVLGANEPMDGINQARLVFPRLWFDQDKCSRLVDVLAAYRADWDDQKGAFKSKPRHDWASHGADAFRYMAVSLRDFTPRSDKPKERSTIDFSPFRLNRQRPRDPSKVNFSVWR